MTLPVPTCELALSGATGGVVLLDAADYAWASQWRWWANRYAYRSVRHDGRNHTVLLHRILMHAPTGLEVDHINGDPFDCRRSNMRIANRSQNAQNMNHARSDSKTGVRGVSRFESGRFSAYCYLNGRYIGLGTFATLEEADAAAVAGRLTFHSHSPDLRRTS